MESQLFNDVRKSLRAADEVWKPGDKTLDTLARTCTKHANKKQADDLFKEFPQLFGKRAGKLIVKRANSAQGKNPLRGPAKKSTRGLSTFKIGRHGTEVQAQAAAEQLKMPDAISYQSALFPQPKDYGVTVKVKSTKPVKAVGGSPLYPWTLEVKLDVTGDAQRVANWLKSFKEKLRAQV
jgi:hypothetical protein